MADITTIIGEGAFDGTVRNQINANFSALNTGGSGISGSIAAFETAVGSGADVVAGVAPGAAGTVLTSNGAAAAPTYQAASGSSILHQATVTLNNATFKALPVTDGGYLEMVAAPGAGKLLLPLYASARLSWAVNYASINANAVMTIGETYLAYAKENPDGVISSLLAGGASAFVFFPALHDVLASGQSQTLAAYDDSSLDQAIYLGFANGGAALTGGDADNVFTASVAYLIWNTTTGVFE